MVPLPKKPTIIELNDYWLISLKSVVMESFERLVLAHLKDITGPLPDRLKFAYRTNRSVVDAVQMGDILDHATPPDSPDMNTWILFMDFSLVLNTIAPEILHSKLS